MTGPLSGACSDAKGVRRRGHLPGARNARAVLSPTTNSVFRGTGAIGARVQGRHVLADVLCKEVLALASTGKDLHEQKEAVKWP